MSNAFSNLDETDTLRAQFCELSLVENDLKRDLVWAQENLAGVRELKKQIQQQIFNAATTSNNGPTTD